MQVPSEPPTKKQLEDCRPMQSDSSKHSPLVAITDQNGYKDLTVMTRQITVFWAVTPCSLVLFAAPVLRMQLVDSKDVDDRFFRYFGKWVCTKFHGVAFQKIFKQI